MSNNEAGAFLNITPDVLKKLDSFDEKLEKIEKHAHTAADALKNGFGSVVVDTSKLENAITSLASKISALNTAEKVFDNIGDSAQQSSVRVEGMSSSISSMAQTLNQLKFSNFSIETFSPENVAKMREAVSQIKSQLKNNTSLSDSDKSTLSKEKAMYEEKLKEYQSFINIKNKIAANANAEELRQQQTTYRKMTNVMESYMKKVEEQKQRYESAMKSMADYAAQSPAQRTSAINNTLSFSANAKTLQDDVAAIKLLKEARLQLDKTDKNYQATLNQINSAIAKHNQALTEAGVKSQQLATRHRNLMDTAGQLSRQLALVFSVSQIEGYISKLANVRGEFELQQRSLEAILQNKAQADQIFNKTVQLAVKSPFQIKELVTFTKQLAAYRIESDKLYDTTKRLADVSAGLGVDMGRLILAYGQVKAAAYLRGTEVRQFTEAGINMYGELQKLFKTRDQADYTTAQIVDMISKRKVTFEDVEQVFENLTSKEGIFYNMQEIQAETLQGKISNLKDSIDVMLNSIGKANEDTLKGAIDAAKVLIENWESVVSIGNALVGVFALLYMHSLRTGVAMKAVFSTNMAANATKTLKTTELLANGFKSLSLAVRTFSANLKAAFVTNLPALGIIAVITAVSDAFTRLQNKSEAILDISKETGDKKRDLYQISDAYKQIISASSNAKDAEISDTKEVIDKKREQINKLVELYNKNGLKIDIQLKDIPQSEIDEYFSKLYNGYANFIRLQESLKIALAENNGRIEGWFGVFGENIETDSKQLTNAYNNVIEKTRDVGNAISLLTNYYDNLSESQKKQYEQQYKGLIDASARNTGESEIAYLERQSKAIDDFSKSIGATLDKSVIKAREYSKQFRIALTGAKGTGGYKEYLREFDNELDDILERVKSRYSEKEWDINGKVYLESVLDTELASQGWEQWKLDHAKERWEIKPKIDEKETDNELNGLDKIFKKWFSSHTYKLGIEYEDLGDKNAFKGFLEEGDTKAAAYKKAKESAERLKNAMDSVFNQKQSGLTEEQWKNAFGIAETVDKKALIEYYEELAKANKAMAESAGWRETKAERDIWSERISVLKEMQSRYEKLNQLMGENRAIEETRSAFKGALDFTQMGEVIKAEDIIPTKQGMIDALEKLLKQIPNDVKNAAKRTGLEKEIAELKIGIQQDYLKEQLDKTKKNIEDMFNGLDLYNKMKKEGFSDEMIKSLFGDLTTTESEIQAEIEKLAGKEGELWEKAYDDLNKKLKSKQDEMFKNRIEQYAQFINDFNNQIENKQEEFADYMKIARDMLNKTGDVKAFTDQVGNIIAKYNQDIAKIETEKFKKSGTYIEMMGELSIKSADELQALIEKLEDFIAKSASNIPADTLKIYINRLNEANEQLDKVKNPFGKSFIKGIKEITELQNKYNAEKSYQNELLQKQVELENELRDIESKRDIAKANGDDTTNFENQIVDIQNLIKDNDNSIANSSAKLQGMSTQMGKMTQGAGAVIGIIDKIVKGIDDSIQATADLFNEIKDIASSYGVDTESGGWQDLSIAMSSLSEMSTNVSNSWNSFKSGDFAGAAVSAIKSVGSVIKGINAIHDAKYERKIKRQQKNIESLQDAYEILKEKIDKAWDITSLNNATKQTTQNIDQQIRSYQEMINAEQKKKDTDDERIKEWNEAIKELQKTKEEIIKQEQMDLGGIGGESEYRDAAESFVQAWMDAFNETEDGLKALNENFNDFIENLIVKQATMRLAQARLKNLFDMIDKSVTEDSDGGISITQKELADIYAEATTSMKGLNEDLLSFVETLGYKPSKKANLSALQQGIQGITETTAEALEALLNSIRFFVNQQTTDITAIRNLLDARYSLESQAETNPMLIELKAQTGYLEIISDRIDRVFAPNSNSRGAGLRVFISD
jgi:DNA repair exonuclease SbcCD ATPase subunit